jgi:predicted transcriptional regulator
MDISIDKAWEVLNADEKRQLVAEKTGIDLSNDVETFASQRMKQQDRILAQFEVLGVDADEYEVVKNYHVHIGKDLQPEKSDAQFRSMYFAETVGIEIGDLEANILSAIKNNPKITISEIAQAFDLTPSDANDIISQLENTGLLKGKQGVNWEVSKSGEDTIKEQDVVLDIEVKYRYAVAAGMGANVINSTRDFCRTLIGLNRLYSRDEINRIKNDQDENTNAWVYRGGFYTKKGTNNTTPYCRHIWEAVVVKKRRK